MARKAKELLVELTRTGPHQVLRGDLALVGLPGAELAAGSPVPGLPPRVLAAAHSAAAAIHPKLREGVGSSG